MPKTKRRVYLVVDRGGVDDNAWLFPYMAFSKVNDAIACSVKRSKRNRRCDYSHSGAITIDLLIDEPTCENVYDESVQDSCDNGFKCSVCGCKVENEEHYHVSGTWNFCPGCGRKVVKSGH